ncbi:hypothetical protein NC653_037626 [Populus alba x Populus x berolinensis]|uniref:Uncharacterized protein n=1 Tax=Populus alba x Populus x berolinensis TaxID=444605 RepID=A0AAD6LER2_9ROSI|nr:hypothetical protein NC653_037626 [Populus alba x Populus x berolinensis]
MLYTDVLIAESVQTSKSTPMMHRAGQLVQELSVMHVDSSGPARRGNFSLTMMPSFVYSSRFSSLIDQVSH